MYKHSSLLAVAVTCLAAPALHAASISEVQITRIQGYTQTSDSPPMTPTSSLASVALSGGPNDFSSVSVLFPDGSDIAVPQILPTLFFYGSPGGTPVATSALFPFGTYDFTAIDATGSITASLDYLADNFTADVPALTAATFDALNGLDPSTALSIGFDSFTPNANAPQGSTLFLISGPNLHAVFMQYPLDPSTTSVQLPANTLQPNTTYSFQLDFFNSADSTDAQGVSTEIQSDRDTLGSFTTGSVVDPATPEPSTLLLAAIGLAAIIVYRKRRA